MEARSTPSKNLLLVSFEGYQDWIVCPGCQQVSSRDEAIGDDYVEDNFLLYFTKCHIEVLLCWPPSPVFGGCMQQISVTDAQLRYPEIDWFVVDQYCKVRDLPGRSVPHDLIKYHLVSLVEVTDL